MDATKERDVQPLRKMKTEIPSSSLRSYSSWKLLLENDRSENDGKLSPFYSNKILQKQTNDHVDPAVRVHTPPAPDVLTRLERDMETRIDRMHYDGDEDMGNQIGTLGNFLSGCCACNMDMHCCPFLTADVLWMCVRLADQQPPYLPRFFAPCDDLPTFCRIMSELLITWTPFTKQFERYFGIPRQPETLQRVCITNIRRNLTPTVTAGSLPIPKHLSDIIFYSK